MPKSLAQQHIRLGHPLISELPDHDDPAWAAWQAHFCRPTASLLEAGMDHGLIGSRPVMTFENRLRHMRNEVALFGRVVTRELAEF
jgi:hypothetical protein